MGDNFELNNRVDVDQLLSGDIIDEEVVNQVFDDIPVDDMRRRGQTEGMLGFFLDVRYIHEEH